MHRRQTPTFLQEELAAVSQALAEQTSVTKGGARLALSHDINEDWNALIQHTAQTLETEGSFTVEPSLGNESSAKLSLEYNCDVTLRLRILGEYNQSGDDSLTLNAKSPNGAKVCSAAAAQPSHAGRHQERLR